MARPSSADPVVIYSNFGPPPGYIVENWEPRGTQAWDTSDGHLYLMGFQLEQAAQLTSVTLPVVWGRPPVEGVKVELLRSEDGMPVVTGGGVVDSIVIPTPGNAQPYTASMLTGQSVAQPFLTANTLYYLYAFPTSPNWLIQWPWNNAGVTGPVVLSSGAGQALRTGTLGAFQLTGEQNPIPEPGTIVLCAAGAGLVLRRARRRRAS